MTEKTTCKPRLGSFAYIVITFFLDNPDEELTTDDMTIKWPGVKRNSIHSILGSVVLHEILVRNRNDDGDYIYKAGPCIAKADICRSREAATAEQVEFRVDNDVPMPTRHHPTSYGKWKPMFAALTTMGQSIVIAETDVKRIKATAQKMRQNQKGLPPHFHIGQDAHGAWRVWRKA